MWGPREPPGGNNEKTTKKRKKKTTKNEKTGKNEKWKNGKNEKKKEEIENMKMKKIKNWKIEKKKKKAQRETTLRPPLRRRFAMENPSLLSTNCGCYGIAAIFVEGEGVPHTINLCRNCYNLRRAEVSESKVTNAGRKAMIEQ